MATLDINRIPAREGSSGLVNVIIDTPRGSRNKYKFDEASGLFRVSRVLPVGMSFPHDFGSVPATRAEDGDPLDVLVLAPAAIFPGCLVTVRLIGVLRAQQVEGGKRVRNDRLLGMVETPVNRPQITQLSQVGSEELKGIEEFFVNYNRAQGRTFRITGRLGADAAEQALRRAMRAFKKTRSD
jgi:inorganic pyrophosphatase